MADIEINLVGPDQRLALAAANRSNASAALALAHAGEAQGHADDASLSATTAAGFIGGVMFASTAAALAIVAEGAFFTVVGDGINTYALLYRKTAGAAVMQASYVSKAAYEGAGGADLIGHLPDGTNTPVTAGVQMKRHGGWPTTQAELQKYADDLVAAGKIGTINLAAGLRIAVTGNGITLDHSFHRLIDHGAVLDGSVGMAAGAAILTIGGSVNPPYDQARNRIHLPKIVGPGRASDIVGVLFEQAQSSGNGPSHLDVTSAPITQCGVGMRLSHRTYLLRVSNLDIGQCGVGIDAPAGAVDAGEKPRLEHGAIYQCDIGFRNNLASSDFFFDDVSFDDNGINWQVVADGSYTMMRDCHQEAGDYAQIPATLFGNGATLVVSGGTTVLHEQTPF